MDLLLVGINILANLVLGYITYLKNPRSATNILFAFLAMVIVAWSVTNYFSLHAHTPAQILFWIRMVMVSTSPLGPTIFLLIHTFPGSHIRLPKSELLLLIVLTTSVMILSLTPYVYSGVIISGENITPIPNFGIVIYAINLIGFLIAGFIALLVRHRQATGIARKQLLFLLVGLILTFFLGAITNLFVVVFLKLSSFVVFGPLFGFIFVGATGYAIIKHRLLDIRIILARSIAFTLLTGFIGVGYTLLVFGLKELLFQSSSEQPIINTIVALFLALSFERLRKFFEAISDHFFFKATYNPDELQSALGKIMSTTIDLAMITTQLLKTLITQMRIVGGMFVLLDGNVVSRIIPVGNGKAVNISIAHLEPLLAQPKTLVFDELEEGILKQIMRELDVSVAIPLKTHEETIGLLLLDSKASGELYTSQDLTLLEILSLEMAVAIQNSQSYDEIKRFNITLSRKVATATQDLQVANGRLKELDKLKDDFVSVASHELRTPMTAIRSYVWMALNRSDIPLSEKMKRYLNRTLISTERLINLVNEMLNISRIESGRVEFKPQAFDLTELINDVVGEVSAKAGEKRLHFQFNKTQIPEVFADPDKVHQVLLNLIGNALKFTPNEGTISLELFTDGRVVEVSVKDTGVGILREDLPRLFKKFSRLDNSYVAASVSGGTGLGLYISKSLIELMGGKIWAESGGQNKGSVFTFSLLAATPQVLARGGQYAKRVSGEAKILEPVAL